MLTDMERTVVLGLAGYEPQRSRMIDASHRDVISVATAIDHLIRTGHLDIDAHPVPLAVAQAEAEEAGEY